jgi:hypothetical protein
MMRLSGFFIASVALFWSTNSFACARPIFVFQKGRTHLDAVPTDMVQWVVEMYRARPKSRLLLDSVTDGAVTAAELDLARRRAQVVRRLLVRHGISTGNFEIVARRPKFGDDSGSVSVYVSAPAATCD